MWIFIATFGLSYPCILIAWISFPMRSLGCTGIRANVLLRSPEARFQQHILWRVWATESSAFCPPESPWRVYRGRFLSLILWIFMMLYPSKLIPRLFISRVICYDTFWKLYFFFQNDFTLFVTALCGTVSQGDDPNDCHDFGPFLVLLSYRFIIKLHLHLCF